MIIEHSLSQSSSTDGKLSYEEELLILILDKTKKKYGPYKLIPVKGLTQSRAFNSLENNNIDLMTIMTSKKYEEKSFPVRICIYKGLLGVRIPMVNKTDKATLNNIKNLDELKKIKMGLVFDWPDTQILDSHNFSIDKATEFKHLVSKLKADRFELLPLGALESYELAPGLGFDVIDNWAIAYPTGYYFFVSKKNPLLAQRIDEGFRKLIDSGEYDTFFYKHFKKYLELANLEKRKIFYIKNKDLPPLTELDKKSLWYPFIWKKFIEIQN